VLELNLSLPWGFYCLFHFDFLIFFLWLSSLIKAIYYLDIYKILINLKKSFAYVIDADERECCRDLCPAANIQLPQQGFIHHGFTSINRQHVYRKMSGFALLAVSIFSFSFFLFFFLFQSIPLYIFKTAIQFFFFHIWFMFFLFLLFYFK
jgi:hypothetical protein